MGDTILLHDASNEDVPSEIVDLLLKAGADPNVRIRKPEGEFSPVDYALLNGRQDLLELYSSNKNKRVSNHTWNDAKKMLAYPQLSKVGDYKQAREILEKELTKISGQSNATPLILSGENIPSGNEDRLFQAIQSHDIPKFNELLKMKDINVNATHPNHLSLLHLASGKGIPSEFAKMLLSMKASPNLKRVAPGTEQEFTPLEYAVAEGRADLIPFYQACPVPVEKEVWQKVEKAMRAAYRGPNKEPKGEYAETYKLVAEALAEINTPKRK